MHPLDDTIAAIATIGRDSESLSAETLFERPLHPYMEGLLASIPRIDGRPEPVCGAYRRSALPAITDALNAGRFKTADVFDSLDVTWLEGLDPDLFRSLNTPHDLDRFHAEFASQR